MPLSLELMQDAPDAAPVAENALAAAIGQKLDQAILQGIGSQQEPLGILNTDGVNEMASAGTPADDSKFSKAVGKILTANRPSADGLAWIQHPDVFGVLGRLQDTTNQPLNKPGWVQGLRPFSTTSLSTANGIIGDFSQVLIGVRRDIGTRRDIGIRVVDAGSITDTSGETHNMLAQRKRLLFAELRKLEAEADKLKNEFALDIETDPVKKSIAQITQPFERQMGQIKNAFDGAQESELLSLAVQAKQSKPNSPSLARS